MALKNIEIKVTKGMNQDNSAQVFDPQTAFYLLNLKNQVVNRSGLQSLTNEKGTQEMTIQVRSYTEDTYNDEPFINMKGHIVGTVQCTSDMGALFVRQDNICKIYRLEYPNEKLIATLLADDTVNSSTNPNAMFDFGDYISGIFCYENSELQKLYWVDGKNELRYINMNNTTGSVITNKNDISCNPSFKLGHTLKVAPIHGGGVFQPGTVQYCFTYYKQYGPETGIVDISPMYYIAEEERGVPADQTVGMSFKVSLINPDQSFDYARVYSITRTSLNGTPIVKLVKDIKIK